MSAWSQWPEFDIEISFEFGKRFNIDLSRRVKHNALLDCELLREVYINLLDAKEPKFNLSSAYVLTEGQIELLDVLAI